MQAAENISQQLSGVLQSLPYVSPEVWLTVLLILVIVTDLLFGKTSAWICRTLAAVGMAFVLFNCLQQLHLVTHEGKFLFGGMLLLHKTAVVFKSFIDVFAIVLILYVKQDKKFNSHKKGLSDLYTIVIASVLGLHLMVMAVNLLTVYTAIEMVSLASYLLVAYHTESGLGSGAGLKYVLFGAASSAVMLYGISLIYALTGSLNYFGSNLLTGLAANPTVAVVAIVLMLVGIGFKLSFIPMHFWVPDVYQGAPTPVTAYLSTLPKIAGFAMLINFLTPFVFSAGWHAFDFRLTLSVIGIITMIAGNFAAVWQTNIKRLLAYSSIGHTGFALMALVTFTNQGISALVFYLVAYAIANIAALMLVSWFGNVAGTEDIDGYKGLGLRHPAAGVCFIIILISLTGIPVSAGFNAKLLVFSSVYAVYEETKSLPLLLLLITGAVTTVISLFYYIKVPLNLFLRKGNGEKAFHDTRSSTGLLSIILFLTALTLALGLFPNLLAGLL
ncbi:NADH-quinone oxidoreductase subunit N [Mucilaginibacter ginkgonis]|uniref:NADH-quinone oxidoreductase subunit N n=1 Tax=Mucilaginibacter ginkgonis TaxID=2682091 RepID=A0A6I4IP34_9SPHI|nr:NADH-quinone oxidoreductase subunit N [Mucilaginibacter ginkgonis]QQL48468.1 NADH-quinone oxidoreductase subunit N [Mucilaginibacter ginkgonis]